jgi:hypothetical protein
MKLDLVAEKVKALNPEFNIRKRDTLLASANALDTLFALSDFAN